MQRPGIRPHPGWIVPLLGLASVACLLALTAGPTASPGRAFGHLLLALGCVVALAPRGPSSAQLWQLRSPLPWLALALGWQGLVSVLQAPVWQPPAVVLGERVAALGAAVGAWRLAGLIGSERLAWYAGAVASLLLALGAATGWSPAPDQAPWSYRLGLGIDPPFGNPNFAIGGLLPLLPLLAIRGWTRSAAILFGLGLASILVHGLGLGRAGHLLGDPVRAVWPLLVVALATWWLLGRRSDIALGALGGLAALALLGQAALVLGWLAPPEILGASGYNRLGTWHGAAQAWAEQPLLGHGAGSASLVIPPQSGFWAGWLAVPGFPEHAHHELLQALIDGGLINLALLLGAVWLTLRPLWPRRQEPPVRLILTALLAAAAAASIESHLIMPGPLAALAVLSACAWRLGRADHPEVAGQRSPPAGGLTIAVAALGLAACFAVSIAECRDRGSVGVQYARAVELVRVGAAERQTLYPALFERIGPVDDLPLLLADIAWRDHRDPTAAAAWMHRALQRLPVHPGSQALGRQIGAALHRAGQHRRAEALAQALADSARLARAAARRWAGSPQGPSSEE